MALLMRATAKKYQIITNIYLKLTSNEHNYVYLSTVFKQSSIYLSCHGMHTRNSHTKITDDNQTSKLLNTTFGNIKAENQSLASTFDNFLNNRRKEATKTIIVEVQSSDSCNDLYSYCSSYGPIHLMHHYTVDKNHFFLVEFKNIESRKALMTAATHIHHQDIIPVQSQMFSFRNIAGQKKTKKIQLSSSDLANIHVPTINKPTVEKMSSALMNHTNDITKQMEILYDMWKLDDIGTRLRFFTAHQMENSFTSLFPNNIVLPFGSSVNGFGKKGCDLDLVMNLDNNIMEKQGSRLVFRTKSIVSDQRSQTKKTMELLSFIMQTFIPGISNVIRILKARVPIIKYDHLLTGLECDFSMTNMTAVYMSELLYIYGESCEFVRPLVFTIRQWASSVNITGVGTPGTTISNFQITLLVLFYLQQKKILPSINVLKSLSRPEDVRISETCDCTFLRNVSLFPIMKNKNNETLESLLTDFFVYYSTFDFSTKAISLRDGISLYKPNTDNLYICNPLEKALNVSKNVHATEVVRFIEAVRNAAELINEGNEKDSRGLLDIFAEKQPRKKITFFNKSFKRVNVADLFDDKINDEHKNNMTNEDIKKERIRKSFTLKF
ncbi:hypothetical protein HCN44_006799 [Aphidius gifuensis]|uniref:Poly(A) RNA polymerase, mitochondrial n=1 Tax=Aphidius gifuensis TaxID=684658 RepID=A0A834Y2T3_APHGI|nr:poly(A) RNA polymerase, mitochondrial-like isoform X2 [Aphidius gifuensis]KAF7995692.1 hypothetical protein HCN44_006799 [Aphidius gifuensis]